MAAQEDKTRFFVYANIKRFSNTTKRIGDFECRKARVVTHHNETMYVFIPESEHKYLSGKTYLFKMELAPVTSYSQSTPETVLLLVDYKPLPQLR